jgi:DNA-binding CsgD family transcriptional regulator
VPATERLALLQDGVAAMLTRGPAARAMFAAALAGGGLGRWPHERGRLHLAFAHRLEQDGDADSARSELRAAEAAFAALGATGWVRRARRELRALQPSASRSDVLSPQELRIATLAAGGMSNREIGRELALSARTVGNHLYRIFPKLEVRTRAGLRDALDGSAAEGPDAVSDDEELLDPA